MSILVIEDEPAIAETIVYALGREGFEAEVCTLGAAGIERVAAGGIRLVVLDVGLPDMSGFEACKRIRAASMVPIIFLTAHAEEIDRVLGLEIGGDDYVAKPFSPRELVARVKVVLKRGAPAGEPAAGTQAWIRIDEPRATASFRGTALELTRYEFLLLKLLASRPGRVFSREQIMAAVWPTPVGSGDRTVDAHVKTLRAKLKRVDAEAQVIRTHRGLGYSLAEPG